MKHWLILVALVLAGAVRGEEPKPDDTLPIWSPFHSSWESTRNIRDPEAASAVKAEINAPGTRALLARTMSLDPEQAMRPRLAITGDSLIAFRQGADEATYNRVKFRMYWYAASRLDGHSADYARTNLVERGVLTFKDAPTLRERALYLHQDCPPSWLKPGPQENQFHVRDGDTVWVYYPLGSHSDWPHLKYHVFRATKHDPKEMHPDFPALLERVSLEAERNLSARGIRPQMGYCHFRWHEMKMIFAEQHHLRWRSEADQNPGTMYD